MEGDAEVEVKIISSPKAAGEMPICTVGTLVLTGMFRAT